jgi:ribosomal protein S18 acetylase RimI-like enzyme
MRATHDLVIEPLLSGDLVALAQCAILDAEVFPHPSLPALVDPTGDAPAVWVARGANGAVIGFIGAARNASVLEIVGLAISPPHRRAGIARALVRTAIEAAGARGCLSVALHVSTTNAAAIALYDDLGFLPAKKLRGYYNPRSFGDGGNAWEMVLRLSRR